jgi:hypothetical protein
VPWQALQNERLILQDYASGSRPLIDAANSRFHHRKQRCRMANLLHNVRPDSQPAERRINQDHPFARLTEVPWQALQNERLILQDYASGSRPLIEQQKRFRQDHLALQIGRRARINHDAKIHFSLANTILLPD